MDKLNEKNKSVENQVTEEKDWMKYCVYLKNDSFSDLAKSIHQYLDSKNIDYRKPSLGYHMTLFTFVTNCQDEEKMFGNISKYRYDREISIGSPAIFGTSGEALVVKVNSPILNNNHRFIVNELMDYVMLENGINANVDRSLFRAQNPFILDNYNPHISVAKKDNGKFEEKILKDLKSLVNSETYRTELCVSRKSKGGVWDSVNLDQYLGFGPSY
jgi:hypothetical protein